MRGMGRVFKRSNSNHWWIAYYHRGKEQRESSNSPERKHAERLLKKRIGEIQGERFIGPSQEKVLFTDLMDGLVLDYKHNGRKSLPILENRIRPIREAFGFCRAVDVAEERIERYKAARLAEGRAPATINRELAAIRRAFRLGVLQRRIPSAPHISLFAEHNVRQGFFEAEDFRAMVVHLPEDIHPLVEFLYLTGWRVGEVRPLQWRQVDFDAGVVRLEPGSTKNDDGREFPFSNLPPLESLLTRQRERTEGQERVGDQVIPWVFHRGGKPIQDFRKAWNQACEKADVVGKIPHDLRRTAVRNLERAGVPRSVAMKLTGHKTEAVYRRYAIVAASDLREGVGKLATLHGTPSAGRRKVVRLRRSSRG